MQENQIISVGITTRNSINMSGTTILSPSYQCNKENKKFIIFKMLITKDSHMSIFALK